jgi:hypothetical protein
MARAYGTAASELGEKSVANRIFLNFGEIRAKADSDI